MGRTGWVSIEEPLAVFADGFRAELERLGYSPFTAEDQLRLMGHLSRWLERGRLGVGELTAARAQEFLAYRQACGHLTAARRGRWRLCSGFCADSALRRQHHRRRWQTRLSGCWRCLRSTCWVIAGWWR